MKSNVKRGSVELLCDTSVLLYLHQLELLVILPALSKRVIVPPAVAEEIAAGQRLGISLPDIETIDWLQVETPTSALASSLVTDLGAGETGVLMLALENRAAVSVIDDALARRVAETLGLAFTGTLGLLLDAKSTGLISAVSPYLEKLQALRFRIAAHTYTAILELAGEIK